MPDRDLLEEMLQQVKVVLSGKALDDLLWFRDELLRWNKKINLTAITDPAGTLEKHLVDSLTLLPYLKPKGTILDMGSGGGFPSIPLKIARPSYKIWSVDAVAKKISFQKHVARSLNFQDFTPLHLRLEDLPSNSALAPFDMVVTRAFAPLKEILELAKPVLALNGIVVAMKGADGMDELEENRSYIEGSGFCCQKTVQMRLPKSDAKRTLLFFKERAS
ncbi:16S rRNA (guanine(527)-N(7))-methyltransferase RsmG [Syntrophotalea acetylenivorans]|uniref:Ribosomal RNA small subunit methyltransferase G n=1 Tax=Syntrophotalea acetylenivorans TaxID=1842532 RepID=A0A1L3GQK0_9BACT|nr:16S rRNA (guanine(527)-N(7))-methyltransferase RsmG [Syntrophotalea acetylenivorans]APG28207.1 16S rRNA (guanine(527)-N(7))-methyltransferase RsmG [Syntrophotalea acetylenivorans]